MAAQLRRAAVSILANIAEGFRRRGKVDKACFMNLAEGSLEECRYYLILAQDLGYGDTCVCQLDLAHFDTLIWPPSNADSPLVCLRCW